MTPTPGAKVVANAYVVLLFYDRVKANRLGLVQSITVNNEFV